MLFVREVRELLVGKSPKAIAADSRFETCIDFERGNYWPSCDEMVVTHAPTGTFWRAVWRVRADDSDYEMPANWIQVRRQTVERVQFVPA